MNINWPTIADGVLIAISVALLGAFATWLRKTLNAINSGVTNTGVTNQKLDRMDNTIQQALTIIETHETRLDGHDLLFARLDGAGRIPKP